MDVTVAICTLNHCGSLRQTLETLGRVRVPDNLRCELLVVDNASADGTAEVVKSYNSDNLPIRYLYEPRRGQCFARNAAIASARGEVILFTDDDVRTPHNWIEDMCAPLLSGKAHAIAGGVKIAPHLERPWMGWMQRAWLACSDYIDADNPSSMVGANMAFSKEVLKKVPGFDTELGPGALGFHDESLFSFQLKKAGYRIASAFSTAVEHHFDESRLLRTNFIDTARKMGRSSAYLAYHWEHETIPHPIWQLSLWRLRLIKWRQQRKQERISLEGMSESEMVMLWKYHFNRHSLIERKRPRNYDKHGLVKLNHVQSLSNGS
ncbi:MAG: glycosyltransferase family 2 protein [Pyrinomonadaceae bacterium]|nr:glycosyltransferase family 2 protein [Pyrinomonadaceae bacterium]